MIELEKMSLFIFKNFSSEEIASIRQLAKVCAYNEGETIFSEGETNRKVYILLEGRVNVTKRAQKIGEGELVAILEAGNVFGEISVLTRKPKTASITAVTPVSVLVIDFDEIELESSYQPLISKLYVNLIEELSKKLSGSKVEESLPYNPSTILLLFGWRWKDIIYEVPFLAEHGYDAIKISPPQEFVMHSGKAWWTMYQPVSHFLSSYYGTIDDFRSMISLCHAYDIKVYADFVSAHMADTPPHEKHIGTNGHTFQRFHYSPLNEDGDAFTPDDFYIAPPEEYQVRDEDYRNLVRVWHLETRSLLNMPKLDFEKSHVIHVLRKYAKYLLSLGVDGFRIDAAKHLSINGLKRILEGLVTVQGTKPFIYQEYFLGSPEGVDVGSYMEKYFKVGPVTCFNYGVTLADVFLKRGGNTLQSLVEYSFGSVWVQYPDNKAIVLIDNHDSERYLSHMLNFKNTFNNAYVLAYIFMLAWPFGIPKVNSSVAFSGIDDPIPETPVWENGRSDFSKPGFPWICQHRWRAIANMVLFRRKMKGARGVTHIWLNGDQVAFSRTTQRVGESVYTIGFVVINNSSSTLERRFETGLPRGTYADLIKCDLEHGKMIGPKIKVEDYGFSTIKVPPYDAVSICIGYSELF